MPTIPESLVDLTAPKNLRVEKSEISVGDPDPKIWGRGPLTLRALVRDPRAACWWALNIYETGSKNMAVVPATKGSLTSFYETRSDKWPVCHCFGAKNYFRFTENRN